MANTDETKAEEAKKKWENTIPTEEREGEEEEHLPKEQEDTAAQDRPDYDELWMLYEEVKNKADEHWEQLVRGEAEFKNFQKRVEKRIADTHKFASEKVLNELLPVIDSLEQGLEQSPENITESIKTMREGIDLTLKMLLGVLGKFGVVQINPVDEPYDPHLHEALSMQEVEGVTSGQVIAVIQKGYTLHGRVIRAARVMVAK